MKNPTTPVTLFLILLSIAIVGSAGPTRSLAQKKEKVLICKGAVLATMKPFPKLRYRCGQGNDYDEKILKRPDRIQAIKALMLNLETFTNPAWWQADVDDLNICELRKKPGVLSKEEQERLRIGDYPFDLFGDKHIRLVLLTDPCYQTGYGGSNAFLLSRRAGKVTATEVLDGYASRADNSVDIDFANQNNEQIIEVSTGTGGLHPELTNYYFVIDPKTNKAVPKNLFKGDKGLTNDITSTMLMSDPGDVDLPEDAGALGIIRDHKLAPSFSIYDEAETGKIDNNGRKLKRTVLKWNGRFYQ